MASQMVMVVYDPLADQLRRTVEQAFDQVFADRELEHGLANRPPAAEPVVDIAASTLAREAIERTVALETAFDEHPRAAWSKAALVSHRARRLGACSVVRAVVHGSIIGDRRKSSTARRIRRRWTGLALGNVAHGERHRCRCGSGRGQPDARSS
ncbi:hypothetical protein K7G98_02825 [Saccharothrix sp. MB29]|nr:hypothetical protein [Saccharothrix sp. MB29]